MNRFLNATITGKVGTHAFHVCFGHIDTPEATRVVSLKTKREAFQLFELFFLREIDTLQGIFDEQGIPLEEFKARILAFNPSSSSSFWVHRKIQLTVIRLRRASQFVLDRAHEPEIDAFHPALCQRRFDTHWIESNHAFHHAAISILFEDRHRALAVSPRYAGAFNGQRHPQAPRSFIKGIEPFDHPLAPRKSQCADVSYTLALDRKTLETEVLRGHAKVREQTP